MRDIKKLCLHPMFSLGLVIRLALIVVIAPLAVNDWYAPFLEATTSQVTLDPWSAWLADGGAPAAFPYGYAMWLIFLPLTLIVKLIGLSPLYGYELTLLAADFFLLLVLHRLLPGRERLLLVTYWLSPVVILASYVLGLNDLIPVLLLALALLFTRRVQLQFAGMACAAAISAKLSMVVALPFFVVYLYNNKALRQRLPKFLSGFFLFAICLGIPFLFSSSGMQMLFTNPEMGKIYRLALNFGSGVSVYIVPLMYLIMFYLVWRVRRLNFDLFQATAGIAFLLIVLTTPASPGWFVWSIPFLVLYQAASGRIGIALTYAFSGLYVLSTLLLIPIQLSNGQEFYFADALYLTGQFSSNAASLLHTGMIAVGAILVMRIWREGISRNDYFRLSRKPFVIGIAGDTGAGKDTFSDAITGLFGGHSVARLSGDNYHLWDRQKPMWQVVTHSNPMANDLESFCNDLIALTDGKSIQSPHYEHKTGKMSKPFHIKSNDFIITSGLHALYMPILRECYDLKIYLDTDEGLRRHFKVARDVHQRGHSLENVLTSFKKREPDSARFIRPQSTHADLILSLQPIHSRVLEELDDKHPLRLKLVTRTRHGLNELSLTRALVSVCGLHVDMEVSNEGSEIQMTIEGDASAADIALAAKMLCSHILEFLDIQPQWQDGIVGLMQLITLSHINQALTKRFI